MTEEAPAAPKAKATTAKTRTATVRNEGDSAVVGTAAALDTSGPADLAAASDFSPSGAPRQVTDIDVDHPAVDNDPRAGTTVDQNRIDFNDPARPGHEIVEEQLKASPDA
ncbi:hypothetical protein SFC76_03010 [Sphingomonas sp. CD22]|uniref:hypothetical protein n=1 Tax=Sphingomonas sp. CD22 TaxID=3100214 RepID=UPI002AE014A1|nr:hypothetical protein [Sphingomonas sp. CD22]MEA1083218.1 hypothetical protein [Sphingomonas sp. CD22]